MDRMIKGHDQVDGKIMIKWTFKREGSYLGACGASCASVFYIWQSKL